MLSERDDIITSLNIYNLKFFYKKLIQASATRSLCRLSHPSPEFFATRLALSPNHYSTRPYHTPRTYRTPSPTSPCSYRTLPCLKISLPVCATPSRAGILAARTVCHYRDYVCCRYRSIMKCIFSRSDLRYLRGKTLSSRDNIAHHKNRGRFLDSVVYQIDILFFETTLQHQ